MSLSTRLRVSLKYGCQYDSVIPTTAVIFVRLRGGTNVNINNRMQIDRNSFLNIDCNDLIVTIAIYVYGEALMTIIV